MKIAVLTNEDTLIKTLNTAGHNVIVFNNTKELQQDQFDMLIVDNDNALKIIASTREKCAAILFITNVFSEDNIVAALASGATDYLIKPVRRNELLTRVEVMLRRAYPNQAASENCEFGCYVFETRSSRVSLSGQYIQLTRKEFDLAMLLFSNLGKHYHVRRC